MDDENLPGKAFVFVQDLVQRAEKAEARVAELEREIEDWKAGSAIEATEADKGRARVAELEKELAAGKLLVHASVAAERVSPRLVAWAGEPEQSGEVDDIAEEATAAIRRVERWAGTDQNGEGGGMATCQHGLNSLGCRLCHGGEGGS